MKRYYPLFLVLIVAFFAVWPLFRPGYIPTHDGEFSIIRIWQFDKVLRSGNLIPRWAPDLNSGYGIPLFIFYYPLPYYFGSAFHTVFSLVDSLKITMALSYLAATIACFFWLRKLFDTKASIIGSFMFLSVPYWFVDIYVRGSVGEVMGIAFVMVALVAIEYSKPLFFTISIAALVLSHNIEAALFLPFIIFYMIVRKKPFFRFILLGLGLSSFFWVPALFEQKYVQGLSNFDFRDHFPELAQLIIPSWGTGFSRPGWPPDEMSQQLGLGVLVTILLSLVYLFGEKNIQHRRFIGSFLLLSAVTIFFMLDISIPLWQVTAPMRFIQYPWRLLSFFIPISALLAAYIASKSKKFWLPSILAGTSIVLAFPYTHPVTYASRSDDYYLSRKEFTDGTTTVGNSFSTFWLSWQTERPKTRIETTKNVTILNLREEPGLYKIELNAIGEGLVKLNVSYFPGWTIAIDGREGSLSEQKGVVGFTAPSGDHKVLIELRDTPLRKTADIVSVLSLFCLLGLGILGHDPYAHSHRNVPAHKRP